MSWDKRCDNCVYSRPDWTNVFNSDHYCSNEDSEEYGNNTEYLLFGCDDWKGEDDE